VKQKLLLYTITNNSKIVPFLNLRNQSYAEEISKGPLFICEALTVLDSPDHRDDIKEVGKGLGLNARINEIIEKYSSDYDWFIRIDDTDSLIVKSSLSEFNILLESDIALVPKVKIGESPIVVDNEEHLSEWLVLIGSLKSRSSFTESDLEKINHMCPNGAGVVVRTSVLKRLYPFPSIERVGDDLWLHLVANFKLECNSVCVENLFYCYENIDAKVKSHEKNTLRKTVIRKALKL
jgi:hypothetical protein